jgi:hypothetical protein
MIFKQMLFKQKVVIIIAVLMTLQTVLSKIKTIYWMMKINLQQMLM